MRLLRKKQSLSQFGLSCQKLAICPFHKQVDFVYLLIDCGGGLLGCQEQARSLFHKQVDFVYLLIVRWDSSCRMRQQRVNLPIIDGSKLTHPTN
jgi:hypothetical protein